MTQQHEQTRETNWFHPSLTVGFLPLSLKASHRATATAETRPLGRGHREATTVLSTYHEDRALTASIKLYYDLDVPGEGAHPLLIAVHGYGANKRQMMREARLMAPPDFAIASLQGFHQHLKEPKEKGGPLRFGFGWLTNFRPEESVELHHRAVLDLVDSLIDEGIARRECVFLAGFSQSCALNFRFAFTHAEVLRGIIGICGGLPGDWDTNEHYAQTNASVLYMHGKDDEFYPPARVGDYEVRLSQRSSDVQVKSYPAGHEITSAMRDDARAWLQARATG